MAAARVADEQTIDLEFYGTDGAVLILASWDEDNEHENPALEVEVLAKYFALNGGNL
ncbi:MAG TPA: hypothetical protein VK850_01950 [Candidatus Binatia bacterium]|nr:hypothetical protein [Candidatus Binatia bacterium]